MVGIQGRVVMRAVHALRGAGYLVAHVSPTRAGCLIRIGPPPEHPWWGGGGGVMSDTTSGGGGVMSDTGVVSPMTPISVPSASSQQASDDGAVAQAPTTTADPRTTELAAMVVRHVPELSLGRLRRSLTRRMALVPSGTDLEALAARMAVRPVLGAEHPEAAMASRVTDALAELAISASARSGHAAGDAARRARRRGEELAEFVRRGALYPDEAARMVCDDYASDAALRDAALLPLIALSTTGDST